MASEDVIELGSSDEEAGPAPKKKKQMPNVMVHIPNMLSKKPGVTVQPAKHKTPSKTINPMCIAKGAIGKSVTVTKVPVNNIISNPFAGKVKVNGAPAVRNVAMKQTIPPLKKGAFPIGIKPFSGLPIRPVKLSVPKMVYQPLLRPNPSSPSIRNLPPGITVKRTTKGSDAKRTVIQMVSNSIPKNVNKIGKLKIRKPVMNTGEVVNLDDDDSSTAPGGPQWYLRPEELNKTEPDDSGDKVSGDENDEDKSKTDESNAKSDDNMEVQNNKEPESTTFIEITIEDSPIKPPNKRKDEVGAELAITIDDSPVKPSTAKKPRNSDDEEEKINKKSKPHSKKKLNYPAEVTNAVEIEIDPLPVPDNVEEATEQTENNDDQIVEIEESPLKTSECVATSTPQKPKSSPIKMPVKPQMSLLTTKKTSDEEFHPVYQQFIDLCFKLENSEDMAKIVEKKIKGYYKQVPKEYTESEAFVYMVAGKIVSMKAGPEKMYLYIKDVVDELNLQRKIAKAQPVVTEKDAAIEEQEKFLYGEDSEFDSKRQRQIRKLEKTLKKLHRAIQKLEEQEVDFDDEEDSVYLLTERYKERMVRVHAKFCQLTNTKMPSEPRVIMDPRPGQPKGPAKKLEKWINRKVPLGTPRPFPDFHDVMRCVREANDEDKLLWNEADIIDEARDLFTRCGKKLQRRRQENEWRLAASRIAAEVDPAEESDELKKKLENNKRLAGVRETEVLNKYADRQNLLNLEAVEIGDKEADESPVESDEDEVTEETSLENKDKRKERIKRLLHEKSKKVSQETDLKDTTKSVSDSNKPSDNETAAEIDSNEKESKDTKSDTKNEDKEENSQEQTKDPLANDNPKSNELDTIHTLSDDSNRLDSDIDELNLLQKLHSGNEIDTSTLESSDSDSPIAISDTLSSGDNKVPESDVISIENSSYSESEDRAETNSNEKIGSAENISKEKKIEANSSNNEKEVEEPQNNPSDIDLVKKTCDMNMEIECSNAGVEIKVHKSNNDEYNESVEDILLASSDDETEYNDAENKKNNPKQKDEGEKTKENKIVTQENNGNDEVLSLDEESSKTDSPENDTCINLRDNDIFIGETLVDDQPKPVENAEPEVSTVNICDASADSSSVESVNMIINEVEKAAVEPVAEDKTDSGDRINIETPEPMEQDTEANGLLDKSNDKIDSDESKVVEDSKSDGKGFNFLVEIETHDTTD